MRTQNVVKTNISYPLIRTRRGGRGGGGVRNVSFSEDFAYVLNGLLLTDRYCSVKCKNRTADVALVGLTAINVCHYVMPHLW